jgi:chromosome segregation ATPase
MNRSGVSSYRSTTPYGIPPDPVETPVLQDSALDRSGSHARHRSTSSTNDWELTLDRMKETLSQQERRIHDLERENKDLRRMLDEVGRRQPLSPQERQQQQSYSLRSRRSSYQQPEDLASRGMTFRSTQLSTPPRDNEYQDDFDTLNQRRRVDVLFENEQDFTPGTRFVAELARLMKMENGHHAPLSVILDKHWDRLKYHMRDD